MKLIIIGGSSAGTNAATRARLVDDHCEIDLIEETDTITFANCGLPYFISDQVTNSEKLIYYTPEEFAKRYHVNVHVNSHVLRIFPEQKLVEVETRNRIINLHYDKLILCNGCSPIKVDYEYLPQEKTFTLKTIQDMLRLKNFIQETSPSSVLVAGGGFIGMEMVDAFYKLGLNISVIEKSSQLLPKLDPEISFLLARHLKKLGIQILLDSVLSGYSEQMNTIYISRKEDEKNTESIVSNFIVMTIGIKPEIEIAKKAGLKIGRTGGIEVDRFLKTSDNFIYAAGDIAETTQTIAGQKIRFPLASTATKQGRIAASNALGESREYEGVTGSYVIEVCGKTIGSAGISEKYAEECKIDCDFVLVSPNSQDPYYPQVEKLFVKLLYERETGRILGIQCFGKTGVDKIVDIISTAIKGNLKIEDLPELDLAYAPMYSMPFHAINLAGRVALSQEKDNESAISFYEFWLKLKEPKDVGNEDFIIIDLTLNSKLAQTYNLPKLLSIPFLEIRGRINELPKDKKVYLLSDDGHEAYLTRQFLIQNGFKMVCILKGGFDWLDCY